MFKLATLLLLPNYILCFCQKARKNY